MEDQFKENTKKFLKELSKYYYIPHIVENLINKFQDDNVEYLELGK